MTERWLLALATTIIAGAGLIAWRSILGGERSRWTFPLMALGALFQLMALGIRGEMRAACPLADLGEILAFLAWSLTLFYLAVGQVYRISLLGLFSAPLVVILQIIALIPGVMDPNPQAVTETNFWKETHAPLSVLSIGALALAAVAALMFLLLDNLLKKQKLSSSLLQNLPPIPNLIDSTKRLLLIGLVILTFGILAGFLTPGLAINSHLITSTIVWLGYAALVLLSYLRGIPPRRLAFSSIALFLLTLVAFTSEF
ncbi:MAG: cytochrome c biogenesis protein CcsA [Verrucomicrobiota bacterium]